MPLSGDSEYTDGRTFHKAEVLRASLTDAAFEADYRTDRGRDGRVWAKSADGGVTYRGEYRDPHDAGDVTFTRYTDGDEERLWGEYTWKGQTGRYVIRLRPA